jgi:hypothetical protein
VFALAWPRDVLWRRIERRVDAMFAAGLVAEVRKLLDRGITFSHTARQAVGYREVLEHLRGALGLDETVALVKTRTRQMARRQQTWLRALPECRTIEVSGAQRDDRPAAAAPTDEAIDDPSSAVDAMADDAAADDVPAVDAVADHAIADDAIADDAIADDAIADDAIAADPIDVHAASDSTIADELAARIAAVLQLSPSSPGNRL